MNVEPNKDERIRVARREAARGFFFVLLPYYMVLFAAIFLEVGFNEGRLLQHPDYGLYVVMALICAGLGAIWLHFKYHVAPMQKWDDAKQMRK